MDEVHVQGRSRKQKVLLDRDFVIERMDVEGREYTQKQVEGCFSQPNGVMCQKMVSWAVQVRLHDPLALQRRNTEALHECGAGAAQIQ